MTYFLREAEKISPLSFCHSKINSHLCSAKTYHGMLSVPRASVNAHEL